MSCRSCCTTRLVHGRSASAVRCGHGRPKEPRDRIHSHHRLRTADKSALGEAVGHIAKYWDGLCAPLTSGRIEIGNGTAERTIRSIALDRKNAHFAGHDARVKNWPTIVSLIDQRQDSFKGIKGLGGLGSDRQTRLSNIPPKTEYGPTNLGNTLRPGMEAMATCGDQTRESPITTFRNLTSEV